MQVKLISHTHDAVELLIFTKSTRLQMSPSLFNEIYDWDEEKKAEELAYISKTVKSSWEFIDAVFLIEGVSRACAQQITRTRNASYAMQSQRVANAKDMAVTNTFEEGELRDQFRGASERAMADYEALVARGAKLEDARGILPMNIQCNLVAKYNLRVLSDLIKSRKSLRAQGEYNELVLLMEKEITKVWPWSKEFFVSDQQIAIEILQDVAKQIGITTGSGLGWEVAKAIDLLRK